MLKGQKAVTVTVPKLFKTSISLGMAKLVFLVSMGACTLAVLLAAPVHTDTRKGLCLAYSALEEEG